MFAYCLGHQRMRKESEKPMEHQDFDLQKCALKRSIHPGTAKIVTTPATQLQPHEIATSSVFDGVETQGL